MNTETNNVFDVLVSNPEPNSRLTKVGTAYPTEKGAGYRFTLKVGLAEGARVVILPSRSRPATTEAKEPVEAAS